MNTKENIQKKLARLFLVKISISVEIDIIQSSLPFVKFVRIEVRATTFDDLMRDCTLFILSFLELVIWISHFIVVAFRLFFALLSFPVVVLRFLFLAYI